MKEFVEKLTDILVKQGRVSKEEADAMKDDFWNRAKESFDNFLLSEGLVSKKDLLKALSSLYEVPSFDVVGYFFDNSLLQNFPKDFLISNAIIPVVLDETDLAMVASEPEAPGLRDKIAEYSSYTTDFRVGIKRDIIDAIREYYDPSPTKIKDIFED